MNYSEIINERSKYHYLLVLPSKTLLLTSGNDKNKKRESNIFYFR